MAEPKYEEDEGASPRELVLEACRRDQPHLIEQVLSEMENDTNEKVAEFFNNVKDSFGNHLLHICAQYGSYDTMDALFDIEDFECDPLTRDDKETPLHTAVRFANKHIDSKNELQELSMAMISLMCDTGCDPRVENTRREKPVDLVFKNPEIREILQETEKTRQAEEEEDQKPIQDEDYIRREGLQNSENGNNGNAESDGEPSDSD